jgi:hypothetical protein
MLSFDHDYDIFRTYKLNRAIGPKDTPEIRAIQGKLDYGLVGVLPTIAMFSPVWRV